jgi:hypothetical protein
MEGIKINKAIPGSLSLEDSTRLAEKDIILKL